MVKKFTVDPSRALRKSNINEIIKNNAMRQLQSKKTVMRGNNRAVPLLKGKKRNARSGNFGTKAIGGGNLG